MRIRMVSLEDGITACGFRKMAACVARINQDTESYYVTTAKYRTIRNAISGSRGSEGQIGPEQVEEIAHGLVGADIVGFSSMSGYADVTKAIVERTRQLDPSVHMVWGGIHPIIHPEDAIGAPVDAICTGEGEFAFEEYLAALVEGRDPTKVQNMWVRKPDGDWKRNMFRPLLTPEEMETLPFPQYRQQERIYRPGRGFEPTSLDDYVMNDGLSYMTLWSIGCPFHCSFCGNTKFIANDKAYKKIRHPSARYVVDQIKDVQERFPHVAQVSFNDDSFMAIPYPDLEEFAELWKAEVDLPFAVYGVIPNYVRKEKIDILTWAGMNRIRMGIQSGSQQILDFYQRNTPREKIVKAGQVLASYAPDHHIPPAYDIIMDNPIETREDVVQTLELLYEMPRPYTLLIYSLKVIPNTQLAADMAARGVDLEAISQSYLVIPTRWANLMLYVLALWRPPRWLFDRMLRRVRSSSEEQRLYPLLGAILRTGYLAKRALWHMRFMDFSITPGRTGYILKRLGIIDWHHRRFTRRLPRPPKRERDKVAVQLPIAG
jgi:anaerobic magnesium-protoporphyrin IX monomethyl ester cyclase